MSALTAVDEKPDVQTPGRSDQAPVLGELRQIPLKDLHESKWNPRQYFAEGPLQELAESIKGSGITTPLIVRYRPEWDHFEIGAGARRFRAAKIAGLTHAPCIVRELDDDAFLKLVSFENLNRQDPHPLDEAAGFRNYRERTHCTIDQLVKETGVSRSQIYARLKLQDLIPEATQACYDGKITASHAILIARRQPKDQEKALKHLLTSWRLPSERDFQSWLDGEFNLEMAKAPFDLSAEDLVPADKNNPAPGSCTKCPKRTINNPELFPEATPEAIRKRLLEEDGSLGASDAKYLEDLVKDEAVDADACTDPSCFQRKVKAHLVKIESQVKAKQGVTEVLKLSEKALSQWQGTHEKVKAGTPGAQVAIIQTGEHAGETVYVKAKPKRKEDSYASYGSEEYKRQQAERELKQKREDAIHAKILEAVSSKVKSATRGDLERIVLNELNAIYDAPVLLELHGISGKGNVPAAVRRLSDQVPKMNDAEFARLVVEVGCMADDGIEPSYLLQAAKRYKVDAQKIRQAMEAEFKRQDQAQKQPDKKEPPQAPAPAKPKAAGKKATPPKKAKAKK